MKVPDYPERGIEDSYPLTSLQEGMLFHNLLAPRSGVDVEQIVIHLREELSVHSFREAWHEVVARNAVLRTSFQWKGIARPVQVVHREVTLPWVEESWEGIAAEGISVLMKKHLLAERTVGFDLSQSPLFRLAIFKVNPREYYLSLTIHHAIVDGRTYPILIKEVFGVYRAIRDGRSLHFEPRRPYREFIEWIQRQDPGGAETFWRDYLKGFAAPTPLVRAKESVQSPPVPGFGECEESFSAETSAALLRASTREGLPLSTFVHGAWAILLGRYSGDEDIVFGVTRACRYGTVPGADSMVGLFLNTLPMRVKISPSQTLRQWLTDMRGDQILIRDHEHTPLASIQEWSEVPRGRSLFDSLVIFENYSLNAHLRDQGGEWENRDFFLHGKTVYPLMLSVYAGREIRVRLRYHGEHFQSDEIRRMLGHFMTILEGLAANLDGSSASLPVVTQAERARLVDDWNRTAMAYPDGETIHGLFEKQAAETPDEPAVEFRDIRLTYHELNVRANLIAARLQSVGVTPGVNVGICVERSADMVAGLFGILKAGGAYVPMDPFYPRERLAYMIEDARIPVILTQRDLVPALPPHHAHTLCLEDMAVESRNERLTDSGYQAGSAGADDLAYVIFTSGSTGRPKGVEIRHRSVCNFLTAMRHKPGISADDILLSVTTLSFDIAGLELYLPLIVGARVVIASRLDAADGNALAGEIEQRNATFMQATPATWRLLLGGGWSGRPAFTMLCGGESLPIELAEALLKKGGTLWNMYGPTETTVWSTLERITLDGRPPSIGRPIGNTKIFIVDRYGQLAPVGIAGELLIGGAGLARGYAGRPDLSAERFVPDMFSGIPGALLYRTGDLARYREDGSVEWVGRLDFQVKVRGFRIELGEVESVLNRIAGVRECVVTVRMEESGENRLVGYVVAPGGGDPSPAEMRRQMRTRLPEYMVPSVIMVIDALPLTPNGKVDRKALPSPDATRRDSDTAYVPPKNTLETQLTMLWESTLNIRPIGVRDNFFDLGGHSLLAVRLFSEVEKLTGKNFPLATLFEAPTIEQLAAVFADKGWVPRWGALVPIQTRGKNPPLYCAHGGGGNVLSFEALSRHLGQDQPLYGLQSYGLDGSPPYTRVEDMAAHYLRDILEFQPEGPYYLEGMSFGGLVAFEMAHMLRVRGKEVALLALLDTFPKGYTKYGGRESLWRRVELRFSEFLALPLKDKRTFLRHRREEYGTRLSAIVKRATPVTGAAEDSQITRAVRTVWEANVLASGRYQPRPYDGPVTIFWARESYVRSTFRFRLGWSILAPNELEFRLIPGTHVTMFEEPNVQVLAREMNKCIAVSQTRRTA